MYVHMGFQSPDAYKTVLEIHVKDGDITECKDISELMRERRQTGPMKPTRPESLEDSDIGHWVSDRFSLDYKSD
jgi:pentatricopeptide repeat protein